MKRWLFGLLLVAALIYAFTQYGGTGTPMRVGAQRHLRTLAHKSLTASRRVVRINQLDPAQYHADQDFATWSPSACSAAAITVIINSYGHHYRLGDILQAEIDAHAITSANGLTNGVQSVEETVRQFGFTAKQITVSWHQLADIGNQGNPILISFPPDTWSGGHLLVVRGGQEQIRSDTGKKEFHLWLADSSSYHMEWMPLSSFVTFWTGFAVLIQPKRL